MSKLGDAIRRSQRIEAAPMGFGAARPAAKATLLVGCRDSNVEAARTAGADFVLVSGQDAKALRAAAGDLPLGLLDGSGATASQQLRQDGIDFLAFEAEKTSAAALLDEELGYVLVLPELPDELLLRSLEPLALEAIYLTSIALPLTVAPR